VREAVTTVAEELAPAQNTRCTICGGVSMHQLWLAKGYDYWACHHCNFVNVAPVPQEAVLKDYYAKSYAVDRMAYQRSTKKHAARDIRFLEQYEVPGRMLEIGSSWGFFLDAARRRGWHVKGIELSDAAANWARKHLELDVTCGTVEASLLPGQYDVVVAWHVIEHVPDLIGFLKTVREVLRPGGLFAVRTPNIASVPAKINGWAWQWVGAPAHLSLFSPRSLGLALEKNGFFVRHISTRRGDAHNPIFETLRCASLRLGIHRQIKKFLRLGPKDDVTTQNLHSRVIGRRSRMLWQLSKIFDAAAFPLYPVEKCINFMNGGPELFVVAERRA